MLHLGGGTDYSLSHPIDEFSLMQPADCIYIAIPHNDGVLYLGITIRTKFAFSPSIICDLYLLFVHQCLSNFHGIQLKNLEAERDDLRANVDELRAALEQETLQKVDHQNHAQSLMEELNFKQKVHEEVRSIVIMEVCILT